MTIYDPLFDASAAPRQDRARTTPRSTASSAPPRQRSAGRPSGASTPGGRRSRPPAQRPTISPIWAGALVVGLGGVLAIDAARGGEAPAERPLPAAVGPQVVAPAVAPAAAAAVPVELIDLEGCTLTVKSVELGDSGDDVTCVQKAMTVAGVYTGPIDGQFSEALAAAATQFQAVNGLYVDGIVGARTAEKLGIWPGDESFVVRTPAPQPGAVDALGFDLSSVATSGADAPPLPEGADAVSGKRIVYYRLGQRVWAIDDDEQIVRSYLVTGSQYNNETPGVHEVYSKSEMTTGWNGQANLPLMVRYLDTVRGAIGFHQIPTYKSDGSVYQTEAELGTRLSGGCQRQAALDAQFMWAFADIGTPVIVI